MLEMPTTKSLFLAVIEELKNSDKLPAELDYSKEPNPVILTSYSFDMTFDLDYGCEGIYLECFITKDGSNGNQETYRFGTFKTLLDNDEAMYFMAKLQADFIMTTREYVNHHLDEFTWEGFDIERQNQEGKKEYSLTMSSVTFEEAKAEALRRAAQEKKECIYKVRDNSNHEYIFEIKAPGKRKQDMQRFENNYDGVSYQFWICDKGYCYEQSEKMDKPKRISESEYQNAYEMHHNL